MLLSSKVSISLLILLRLQIGMALAQPVKSLEEFKGRSSWYSQQLAILLLRNRPCLMSDLILKPFAIPTIMIMGCWKCNISWNVLSKENVGALIIATAKDAVKFQQSLFILTVKFPCCFEYGDSDNFHRDLFQETIARSIKRRQKTRMESFVCYPICYASTRPSKNRRYPIAGKPMIQHVYERACHAVMPTGSCRCH